MPPNRRKSSKVANRHESRIAVVNEDERDLDQNEQQTRNTRLQNASQRGAHGIQNDDTSEDEQVQEIDEVHVTSFGSQNRPQVVSRHYIGKEVDLSKHNTGLQLIPEFNGKNWDDFKRKIETQFSVIGLDTFLEYPPDQNQAWEKRNDKLASAQICLRLPQAQYKQISMCKNTCQIWSRLQEIYEETAESKAANLFIKFIHYKKGSSQSMKSYLDNLIELFHDLKVYDIDIGEIALCAKALDGLPENYQQIKAAVRATQVISIPRLTNVLLSTERDEEVISKNCSSATRDLDVTNLNTEMTQQQSKRKSKNKRFCSKCKKTTHNTAQCWILNPNLRPKREKKTNKMDSNNTIESEDNNSSLNFQVKKRFSN
jgi:hypothetical protein